MLPPSEILIKLLLELGYEHITAETDARNTKVITWDPKPTDVSDRCLQVIAKVYEPGRIGLVELVKLPAEADINGDIISYWELYHLEVRRDPDDVSKS